MEMKAYGANYICVPIKSKYGYTDQTGKNKLIIPETGDIYDFTDHEYAWVCGHQYSTTNGGTSSPYNAAGKKIRITKYVKGDPDNWGIIRFEIIEEED